MAIPKGTGQIKRSRRSGRSSGDTYAALDLGTNNCRLLVAEPSRTGRFRVIDSFSQVVRLGEGLAHTGALSDAAMDRAMEALRACQERVKTHAPVRAHYIATQACRAASNGKMFISKVREDLGMALEAISPKQEAKYALLGSLDLIDEATDFAAVVDIGGGSTEICWVDAKSSIARGVDGCALRPPILGWASFPFGVVTLTESHPLSTTEDYSRLVAYLKSELQANDAYQRFGPLFKAGRGQLIGNSGTVTSVAAVSMGLQKYVRSMVDGVWLDRTKALETCAQLTKSTQAERAAQPCIGADRAELIIAGCALMEAIWETWPADRMRVGDRGLREGILLSLIHGKTSQNTRRKRGGPRSKSQKTG